MEYKWRAEPRNLGSRCGHSCFSLAPLRPKRRSLPSRNPGSRHHAKMAAVRVRIILAAAASLALLAQAEDMKSCGAATYYPSEYTCYNNSSLCPIMYSLPSVPCSGAGGCYASEMFSCEGGSLKSLPKASGPFTLVAHGTRATYQNMTVKACGNYLAVGANARQCTSCSGAGPDVQCANFQNRTVLLPSGEMVGFTPFEYRQRAILYQKTAC
jgi:hypothetical protein